MFFLANGFYGKFCKGAECMPGKVRSLVTFSSRLIYRIVIGFFVVSRAVDLGGSGVSGSTYMVCT